MSALNHSPRINFFLDVSVETAQKRINERGGPTDWKETSDILQRARRAYHETILHYNGRIITIDAERDLETVVDEVTKHITNTFE